MVDKTELSLDHLNSANMLIKLGAASFAAVTREVAKANFQMIFLLLAFDYFFKSEIWPMQSLYDLLMIIDYIE